MIGRLLPRAWHTDVDVSRSSGLDEYGDPTGSSTHTLAGCLVAPRGTKDPDGDRTQEASQSAVLYAGAGADLRSTDMVTVPPPHPMAGTYRVAGRPARWVTKGVEVPLEWVPDGS